MVNASFSQALPIIVALGGILLWAMKNLQFQEFIHPSLPAAATEFKLRRNGSADQSNPRAAQAAASSRRGSSTTTSDPALTEDWIFVYNTNGENQVGKKFCLYEKEKVGFGNPYSSDYKVLAIGAMQWFNLSHGWWTPYAINKATRPTTFSIEPVYPNTSAVQVISDLSDNVMEVTSEFRLQVGTSGVQLTGGSSSAVDSGSNSVAGSAGERFYLTQRSAGGFVYCYDCILEEHMSENYTWRLKRWVYKEANDDPQAELWFLQNVGTGDYLKACKSWYSGTKNLNEAARFCVYY
eukprot:TRINITY_DN1553_c0_g1_i1.p1 TRINITY_DN1553_c0_g1~~TRINITY_DN1553_c0_g1_i1.p1  ORF type:complete len:294 (-),score=68.66 TRINITY_DN1553_c0_g1_i1:67-948(-)